MSDLLLELDVRARSAWPWLPSHAVPGAVLLGPTGEVLRVAGDGALDEVLAPGHPHGGAARDPTNTRQR